MPRRIFFAESPDEATAARKALEAARKAEREAEGETPADEAAASKGAAVVEADLLKGHLKGILGD